MFKDLFVRGDGDWQLVLTLTPRTLDYEFAVRGAVLATGKLPVVTPLLTYWTGQGPDEWQIVLMDSAPSNTLTFWVGPGAFRLIQGKTQKHDISAPAILPGGIIMEVFPA